MKKKQKRVLKDYSNQKTGDDLKGKAIRKVNT
jgi:hypothetical protein